MYSVIKAMQTLAEELGVVIKTHQQVEKIHVENKKVIGITANNEQIASDFVVSGADYHHTETLLDPKYRQYSEAYWTKRTFAPSALLFFVGFSKKLSNVAHHTLFFDVDFEAHARDIYDTPQWPEAPLFYASFPSKTDGSCAPEGKEAGIFLIPLAPGLTDIPELRSEYFEKIMTRFENVTNQEARKYVIFKESFCINDFVNDYNSYKGNAYGLANTLRQTAFLRPKLKSKKVKNLFFTGQLSVPGPGVPPSLISGKLVSGLIQKEIATS
jgi:phytoene desaturase